MTVRTIQVWDKRMGPALGNTNLLFQKVIFYQTLIFIVTSMIFPLEIVL